MRDWNLLSAVLRPALLAFLAVSVSACVGDGEPAVDTESAAESTVAHEIPFNTAGWATDWATDFSRHSVPRVR
jgi:hypothetical protein